MDDADLVAALAADMVRQHGPEAIAMLAEKAEIAASLGDELSAQAWRDIAEVAARLVGQ